MMFGSGRIFEDDLLLPDTHVQVVGGGQLDGELATVIKCDDEGMAWIHFDRTGELAGKPTDRVRERLANSWMPKTRLRRLPRR